MDNKKKFFIAIGIVFVVYLSVMSLNATHKNDDNKFSKEKETKMIEDEINDSSSFVNKAKNFKQFFSFLIPEVDMFDKQQVSISSGSCKINNSSAELQIVGSGVCQLKINKDDASSRKLIVSYTISDNKMETRGFANISKRQRMYSVNSSLGFNKNKKNPRPAPASQAKKVLTIKLKDSESPKEENVDGIEEKKDIEIMIPTDGVEIIFQCAACKNSTVYIKQV